MRGRHVLPVRPLSKLDVCRVVGFCIFAGIVYKATSIPEGMSYNVGCAIQHLAQLSVDRWHVEGGFVTEEAVSSVDFKVVKVTFIIPPSFVDIPDIFRPF